MAIKVKHEGSAASRMSASAAGGAAKRAMESAALVKPGQIQTLQAAHASAPGISTPHATLISAPGGGAHAPLIGGGGGVGSTSRVGGGSRQLASAVRGNGVGTDYKVTGTDRFSRPDDDSEWDWSRRQWIRRWLPGEKEAEALQRVLSVKENFADIAADRELKGKITLDDLRTQNAIGQYIQQKRADVASNPNIETLKGQLENARNTLFKSIAEKARGVPVSPADVQNAGTDISSAITSPQGQPTTSTADQPFDYGVMFGAGMRLFGNDGAVNSGADGGSSSSFDSLYELW